MTTDQLVILALRKEAALLLGYPHYAAMSLVPKMAQTAEEVLAFLRDLGARLVELALKRAREAAPTGCGRGRVHPGDG